MEQLLNNLLRWADREKHKIVVFFFLLLLLVGLCIFRDYGLRWDEESQWKNNGLVTYNYVFGGERDAFFKSNEKYHGQFFEVLLVAIEKILHLSELRNIYFMRHFVTFFVFFISAIYFYKLALSHFKNWKYALLACSMFLLSPRIFADSFYNTKDLPFLSIFVVALYYLTRFLERPSSYACAIRSSLTMALAIDTRLTGLILPALPVFYFIFSVFVALHNRSLKSVFGKQFLVFTITLLVFVKAFWPVLWHQPFHHFQMALAEMSKYHLDCDMVYLGSHISSLHLPWHYIPVWIAVTTPPLYLVLFVVGAEAVFSKFFKRPLHFLTAHQTELTFLFLFFAPILAIILLQSVIYDAWRHVFFLNVLIVLIATSGIQFLVENYKKYQILLFCALFLSSGTTTFSMIRLHPFENVYFNFLAGENLSAVQKRFELDYWGLSSRSALEYVVANDHSDTIKFFLPPTFRFLICRFCRPQKPNAS